MEMLCTSLVTFMLFIKQMTNVLQSNCCRLWDIGQSNFFTEISKEVLVEKEEKFYKEIKLFISSDSIY